MILSRRPLKKSGKALKVNTPLTTKKPLPSPTKGIKKRSDRTQLFYDEQRIPFVKRFLESHPYCQIRWDDQCQGIAVDVDEIKLRSRGGGKVPKNGDESNFLATCRICHTQKTVNPAEAKRRGFTK